MTLRANITTTYREANANPPRDTKNFRKKAADQGVHESEVALNPMKPATKTRGQGKDSLAVPKNDQGLTKVDAFERGSLKNTPIPELSTKSVNTGLDSRSGAGGNEAAPKPALARYGPGTGAPVAKITDSKSQGLEGRAVFSPPQPSSAKGWALSVGDPSKRIDPRTRTPKRVIDPTNDENHNKNAAQADEKHGASASQGCPSPAADSNLNGLSIDPVQNAPSAKLARTDGSQDTPKTDKAETLKAQHRSLPIATPTMVRLAQPSAKSVMANTEESPPASGALASVSAERSDQSPSGVVSGLVSQPTNEDTMQRELTAALQYGRAQEDNSQTDSATGGDVAKHLQSEGVFGISASGRNLGTVDFIRQKQFEYKMDQKPFTADGLLLEAEKAIHKTLNSDQSSAVSKSLLQAAESVNAYRNQSVKSSEHAEVVAKPSRLAASTGKKDA